jgi:hypothetical protein
VAALPAAPATVAAFLGAAAARLSAGARSFSAFATLAGLYGRSARGVIAGNHSDRHICQYGRLAVELVARLPRSTRVTIAARPASTEGVIVLAAGALARRLGRPHAHGMFVVDEATAAAIRAALQQGGELSAVVELRRHFPLITDNAEARRCVRTIAGWKPLPPAKPKRARRAKPRED